MKDYTNHPLLSMFIAYQVGLVPRLIFERGFWFSTLQIRGTGGNLMTRLLNRSVVNQCITMEETMRVVEDAFVELQRGTAKVPHREQILLPDQGGDCFFMPAYLQKAGGFGIKISPYFEGNPQDHDLPPVIDVILLLDHQTGFPLAIIDAQAITVARTGAVCGIAAKYLAREDARTVALVGMGTQAPAQLEAVCSGREVKSIRVTSKHPRQHTDFVQQMTERLGVPLEVQDSVEETVRDADIVLLATSSVEPVVRGEWIAPGSHVSSILSAGPQAREVDTALIEKSKVVCDSSQACLQEAGELLIPIQEGAFSPQDVYGELGELVTGVKEGREEEEEITFFKTVGLAIQDIATAKTIYQAAKEKDLGAHFDFMH